jgi:hypothetical protein
MPFVNKKLGANVKVSVSKGFITDNTVKTILLREHDWNEPKSEFLSPWLVRSIQICTGHASVLPVLLYPQEYSHMFRLHPRRASHS